MNRKRLFYIASILIVTLLLTACEGYVPSVAELTALAEQYHGDDKEMIQATAVARYLTADAAQAAQAQAQAQIAALEATRQAAARAEQNQWLAMTAEAQSTANALSAQGTQQAFAFQSTQQALAIQSTVQAESVRATREAESIRATQTAEAHSWAATATAETLNRAATATAEHKADRATATAEYKADRATETRQAWEGRATATAECVQATTDARIATATIAAEKREIVLGYGRDYGIPFVLLLAVIGLVLASQVKANLPTAIAFQTRTHSESQVILGRGGAEALRRKGLALSFLDGRWQKVQTLLVGVDDLPDLGGIAPPPRPALSEDEAALVAYAVQELNGEFIINKLYEAGVSSMSKRALTDLAQRWELRGWLTGPEHRADPRRVTDELLSLCPALGAKNGDTVTRVTRGDTPPEMVTRMVTRNAHPGDTGPYIFGNW